MSEAGNSAMRTGVWTHLYFSNYFSYPSQPRIGEQVFMQRHFAPMDEKKQRLRMPICAGGSVSSHERPECQKPLDSAHLLERVLSWLLSLHWR